MSEIAEIKRMLIETRIELMEIRKNQEILINTIAPEKDLLTIAEAARLLGVTTQTLRRKSRIVNDLIDKGAVGNRKWRRNKVLGLMELKSTM